MVDLTQLPLGTQSFSALRAGHQIYVDKTAMIAELARGRNKIFLARPRRFGKSLLVSTFASLFERGLADFDGLAIAELWQDKTYPVVQLDFSTIANFDSVERFESRLKSMLSVRFGRLGFTPSGHEDRFMDEFSEWLSHRDLSSVVLLIDEYDSPLTGTLNEPVLFSGIQSVLREFYNILKSNEGGFRFLFLTGITRFSNTSIFSGFNNLNDISLEPDYGTLLGYTESELNAHFNDFFDQAAETVHLTRPALMTRLRDYYDGFSFDRDGKTHVYCPWSILNFLSKNFRFENYWFASGGQPSVLMNFLAVRKLEKPLDFLNTVSMDPSLLLSSAPYDALDVNALLHQTGYLTIRSVDAGGTLQLGYPNREVAASMALLYAKVMVGDEQFTSQQLLSHMLCGNVARVVEFLNRVLNALDYQRYPIRDEASLRGALQILMIGLSLRPQIEVHTAKGRSDLEVETGDFHWVFELKFAKAGTNVASLCREALAQIRDHRYGQTAHGRQVIRVAMVFEETARQITEWEKEEEKA